MNCPDAVVCRKRGVPVGIFRFVVLIRLLALASGIFPVAQPIVFIRRGINVHCQVMVVVGGQHYVQPFGEQVTFAVFQRRDKRMSFAVFFSEYDVLVYAGLYFLIEMRIVESHHQAVCPRLVYQTDFSDNRFIVELVIKTLYVVYLVAVGIFRNSVFSELGDIIINVIIVVRKVLESVYFVHQSVSERLPEVDIRFMGVE